MDADPWALQCGTPLHVTTATAPLGWNQTQPPASQPALPITHSSTGLPPLVDSVLGPLRTVTHAAQVHVSTIPSKAQQRLQPAPDPELRRQPIKAAAAPGQQCPPPAEPCARLATMSLEAYMQLRDGLTRGSPTVQEVATTDVPKHNVQSLKQVRRCSAHPLVSSTSVALRGRVDV